MNKQKFLIIITLFILTLFPSPILAQSNDQGPIYIVQPGENLSSIAQKFGVDVNELIAVNNIIDSNLISAGTQLIIPGLEGITGILTVTPVQLGETFSIIQKKYQISSENLLKLNKLTSPSETFVGTNLVLPAINLNDEEEKNALLIVDKSSSLLIDSFNKGLQFWETALVNQENDNFTFQLPKEPFIINNEFVNQEGSIFSPYISRIELRPLPFSQGHTVVFKVFPTVPLELDGEFDGQKIKFFLDEEGMRYAIESVHALREPGLANLSLSGTFENGESFNIDQLVLIESGGYVNETLTVESTLINETLNIQESEKVQSILAKSSEQKYWSDTFRYPVDGSLEDETIGFSSYFGNRRSYNNGEYFGFHGGLDFYILLNTFNTYATAPGVVAYAGPMDIRGLTIFIDHGQGVLSGYAHLNEIFVEEGQFVNQGDLIGLIGKTGRVTGPHLHWDIWVNGNQVDPFDWIYNQYP